MDEATSLSFEQIVMEGIKEMVFVVRVIDQDSFIYEFFNPAVLEKTSLTSLSIGRKFHEVHSSKLASFLQEKYRTAVLSRQRVVYEDSFYSASNQLVYSKTHLTPCFDQTGKCTHIVSLVQDVTDEKACELENKGIRERLEESNARYRALYESNAAAIFTVDLKGYITGGNPTAQQLSGYKMKEIVGRNFIDFVYLEDRLHAKQHFLAAVEGECKDSRLNFTSKSEETIGCLIKFISISPKDKITGFYMVVKDMTELDKVASLYKAGEKNFQIIAENVHDVIVLMNHQKVYLYLSPSVETIYGYPASHIIGQKAFFNVHPEDVPAITLAFDEAAESGSTFLLQLRLLHKERGWVWSEINGTPVYDEKKQFEHMVMVARDISLQKEYENQLMHFAYYDSLTELPNRRYFQEYAAEQMEIHDETQKSLAVMILDIDDFKEINDQWGHEIGDAVIQEFGYRLSTCIHGTNMAARLGGDEFVVLVTNAEGQEQVADVVDSIYQTMEKPFTVKDLSLQVSISTGIAFSSDEKITISALMKRADMAMYKAKNQEKNSFQVNQT